MAGFTTTLQNVEREKETKQVKKMTDSSEGGFDTKKLPLLCRVGDPVPKVALTTAQNGDSSRVLSNAMPNFGVVPLPYDDVFDISMYSSEEIDNNGDHMAEFAGIDYQYACHMKTNSRRNVAGSWIDTM